MGNVKDAIKAEAEAQGFDMVIDVDAVFFGGTDITEPVLARLNAGQPAAEGGDEAGGFEDVAAGVVRVVVLGHAHNSSDLA